MMYFTCPVCNCELVREDQRCSCRSGHSFDYAKSGYLNLLLSQKSKGHGDDKGMVRARKEFLDQGYYASLQAMLAELAIQYTARRPLLLDAGCGECYYTAALYNALAQAGRQPSVFGIDVSKNALTLGTKRSPALHLAVASVFRLPVPDTAIDLLLSVFAPFCASEFLRVLKRDGILLRVYPLERHLFALKQAVYDQPYPNQPEDRELEGFYLEEFREVRGTISLSCNADVKNLFAMTPYYYKTAQKDQQKLDTLDRLETEVEFGIGVYRKTGR